jgi:hypothetical protein
MKNTLLIDDDFDHLVGLAVALVEAGYQVIPKIDADSAEMQKNEANICRAFGKRLAEIGLKLGR